MRSAARTAVFAALAFLAATGRLPAQERPLTLGQWVRVVQAADSAAHQGRLMLVLRDTVVLDARRHSSEFIALGANGRLERSRHIRSHPLAGAVVGAGFGMAIGTLSWSLRAVFSCLDLSSCHGITKGMSERTRVALGGLVGLGLGALVGAHVYTTRWDPVPPDQLDRLRAGSAPRPGVRVGVGVSQAF